MLQHRAAGSSDGRFDAFRSFAKARAEGQILLPPTALPPEERRLHVRQTILEDHDFRIHVRPEESAAKFKLLSSSPYWFYRGSALLFFRDLAGSDAHFPKIVTLGNVLPESFGVMPNEDGEPFFGVSDFDEAYIAPFSWDLRRAAVGFNLLARENNEGRKRRGRIVSSFLSGYRKALKAFDRKERDKAQRFVVGNSPAMVDHKLEACSLDRKVFLMELIDLEKHAFRACDEIVPISDQIDVFQKAIDEYCKKYQINDNGRLRDFRVRDVAIKKRGGVTTLGQERFYILLEGNAEDSKDDVILEMKLRRDSVLRGLVPSDNHYSGGNPEGVIDASLVHQLGGDPFHGYASIKEHDFLVREQSPYRGRIDLSKLDRRSVRDYAQICGDCLAQIHARSEVEGDVSTRTTERQILTCVDWHTFTGDLVRFAEATAERVVGDATHFRSDYKEGVFKWKNDAESE